VSFNVETALETLGHAAAQRKVDERLTRRLSDVHELLGRDLHRIEEGLHDALASGPSPGRDAASHLVRLGGKRVRPMALLLSTACFGPIAEPARQLATVAEM